MSRLVIFFPMVGSGSAVRVRREFVEFGGSLVRLIWHGCLPSVSPASARSVHSGIRPIESLTAVSTPVGKKPSSG
jgi:hypothetical protein